MDSERFVRVELNAPEGQHAWGLWDEPMLTFTPIWCEDTTLIIEEFGEPPYMVGGITNAEIATIVDAEDADTPDAAWVALAKHRLIGNG